MGHSDYEYISTIIQPLYSRVCFLRKFTVMCDLCAAGLDTYQLAGSANQLRLSMAQWVHIIMVVKRSQKTLASVCD